MDQLLSQRQRLPSPAQVALTLYSWSPTVVSPPLTPAPAAAPASHHDSLRVVCISDTHTLTPTLPDGDVLLHAGDLTTYGSREELQEQLDWLNAQPHRYKVCIAGNHDVLLDPRCHRRFYPSAEDQALEELKSLDFGDVIYLNNTSTKLCFDTGRTLNVWGSPQTPAFGYPAFQHDPKLDVWAGAIPPDTDVVLSHGPPRCHLDSHPGGRPFLAGSVDLLRELRRAKPRLMLCGHIHEGYGRDVLAHDDVGVQALVERFLCADSDNGSQGSQPGWLAVGDLLGRLILSWFKYWVQGYWSLLSRGVGAGLNVGVWRLQTKAWASGRDKDRDGKSSRTEVTHTIMVNAALEASRRDPRVKEPVVIEL